VTPILSLRDVAKRWGGSSGLEPISIDVAAGELVVVQGRSGSGKSTLLAILAGWCDADAGRVDRFGEWGVGEAWREWRHTSVVPQVLANVAELSVRENVAMPLRLAGATSHDAMATADDVIDRLALGEQTARRPGEISVGQQQRLAVARAVVMPTTLLLADEPTSHQDATHAEIVMAAIERAAADGAGVLVASHDPAALNVADRIIQFDV
jgi:putative ABC transport system ATP-binding protein